MGRKQTYQSILTLNVYIRKLRDAGNDMREKLEVTSVATNKKLNDIPQLIEMSADTGVKDYFELILNGWYMFKTEIVYFMDLTLF